MKHILNNLTDEEKNAIRGQHTGGMKVSTDNFTKLVNSKLGEVKPIVKEQYEGTTFSKAINECFETHFPNTNMKLPMSCEELAKEIMENKKLPDDIGKFTACSSDLTKMAETDIFSTMGKLKDVGDCILKKASSPVKV
jgi:hypothetical protein